MNLSIRARPILLNVTLGVVVVAVALTGCGSGSGTTSSESSRSTSSPAKKEGGSSAPKPAETPKPAEKPEVPTKPSRVIVTVKGAPKGTGTITEAEFEQGVKQSANFRGLKEPPQPGDKEYVSIRNEVLGELIIAIWAFGQGELNHVEPSHEEIANALRKEEDTLLEAGFTQATMEERVKQALITSGLEARLKKIAKHEHENPFALFHREDVEIETKWPPRTHCAKGFVVQQCGNYQGG